VTAARWPIRWAAGPLTFELDSAEPAIRALAETVFRPWISNGGDAPSRAWRIDHLAEHGRGGEWQVSSSAGADARVASAARAVSAVEYGAVAAIAESSLVTTHGALVVRNGRGVLLAGRAESGKSTLACALWRRGASLLGDDLAILDVTAGQARPAPRRVSLRAPSRALLGDDLFERIMRGPSSAVVGDSHLFHPHEVESRPRPSTVELRAIVLLARLGSTVDAGRLQRIAPAHALLALLPYTNVRTREPLSEAIRILAPLAERVPIFDLGRGPLDEMAAAVEHLAGLA
jgi:hypothetical protein